MTKEEAEKIYNTDCIGYVGFPEKENEYMTLDGLFSKKDLEAILILWEKDYD